MPKIPVALALAALVAACGVQPTPEPTPSAPADLAAMNGYWLGEYDNAETGRSGSISMSLHSWPDSVSGDAVMVPRGSTPLLAADVTDHVNRGISAEVLHLSFRRVAGGMVEASVEPYFSQDCACVLSMTLQATPSRNQIAGDFVISSARGLRQQGRWSAERQLVASR
jgi:hypothetical protein